MSYSNVWTIQDNSLANFVSLIIEKKDLLLLFLWQLNFICSERLPRLTLSAEGAESSVSYSNIVKNWRPI